MGGCIGITIREENGKEHRMCRWTNPTPYFINHSKFIEKDKEHLEKYLKTWYEMVDDYNGPKKMNMSDVYAPSPYLAPMEYGLIVVDYKTNTVLHSQGYTSLGKLLPSSLGLRTYDKSDESKEELEDAKKLFNSGKVISAEAYNQLKGMHTIPSPTFDEVLKNATEDSFFKKRRSNFVLITELNLDMSPWVIKNFGESAEGIIELRKEVNKLGFKITDEEEKVWVEFLERYEER